MKLNTPVMVRRTITLDARARGADAGDRNVEMLLATETPCSRGWFDEVLKCTPDAVDMSFFGSGRAPFCVDHDLSQQIGIFDAAAVDGGELRAVARVSRNPKADAELIDIRDGIRVNVSVGYMILEHEFIPAVNEYQRDLLIVTKWRPMEGSLCAIGLDEASGIGRSNAKDFPQELIDSLKERSVAAKAAREAQPTAELEVARDAVVAETPTALEAPTAAASAEPQSTRAPETERTTQVEAPPTAAAPEAERIEVGPTAGERHMELHDQLKAERARIAEINALGNAHGLQTEAARFIGEGLRAEDFRTLALERMAAKLAAQSAAPVVDLTPKEQRQYQLGRAVRNVVQKQWGASGNSCFEEEVSRAALSGEHAGTNLKRGNAIVMPWNVMQRATSTTLSGGTGQHLVPQEHRQVLPFLVSDLALVRAGMNVLTGLRGDVDFPAGDAYGSATTPGEVGGASESEATFKNYRAFAKPIVSLAQFSRTLLNNSDPSVDAVIEQALRDRVNEKLENQCFQGTGGTDQFTGFDTKISGTSADFASGTITYPAWLNVLTVIDDNKGLKGPATFITSMGVIAKSLSTYRDSGNSSMSILTGMIGLSDEWLMDGSRVLRSHEVKKTYPSAASPSVLTGHGLYAGLFNRAFLCMFGPGVQILVDEYTGMGNSIIKMYAHVDADLAIPEVKHFAKADNINVS